MEKHEIAIQNFVNRMNYINNDKVLGIVFYGSFLTGFNNKKSDIDLHIIMDDEITQLVRGASMQDGFKIEYFEKPLHDLYESADNDFLTQNNALLPIIGYGRILFDKIGAISKLQNYVLQKYSVPLIPLSEDDAKELAVIIDNRIRALQSMLDNDKPEFNHNYHLVIEKMRKFYSRLSGCSDIPVAKAFRLYSNKDYRESFCNLTIPDENFLRLYFEATTCCSSNNEKMNYIHAMYEYTTRNLEVNPNEYRILIKSRNNPFNNVHK